MIRRWFGVVAICACSVKPVPVVAPDSGVATVVAATPNRAGPVTGYKTQIGHRAPWVAIRSFVQSKKPWVLAVDPMTLKTAVLPDDGAFVPTTWQALERTYAMSPWFRARADAAQHAASLQDAGLTHLLPSETGVALTVDLCPSTKHFDMRLVQKLLDIVEPGEKPIPIAFALSGVWLLEHEADFAKLKALDGTDLTVTWINHSMHHRYSPKAVLTQNFMLEPGTNPALEVLDAEVVMLEHGVVPSTFFRFPGLVSEPTLVSFVTELGLIPVGSDAWLAKGERARSGSIVLVHGNGNEARGVDDFLQLLSSEKKAISAKQFLMLDLREGVVDEEEPR